MKKDSTRKAETSPRAQRGDKDVTSRSLRGKKAQPRAKPLSAGNGTKVKTAYPRGRPLKKKTKPKARSRKEDNQLALQFETDATPKTVPACDRSEVIAWAKRKA